MAHKIGALKEQRQNRKRRLRNRIRKTVINTTRKSLAEAVSKKDLKEANRLLPLLFKNLDKAGKRNIFHRNKIARIKSRYQIMVNNLAKEQGFKQTETDK